MSSDDKCELCGSAMRYQHLQRGLIDELVVVCHTPGGEECREIQTLRRALEFVCSLHNTCAATLGEQIYAPDQVIALMQMPEAEKLDKEGKADD